MTTSFRRILTAIATTMAAGAAAIAMSAPASAATVDPDTNANASTQVVTVHLSDTDIANTQVAYRWAEAICNETTGSIMSTSSSWFSWSAPTPNGQVGVDRCAADIYYCVKAGGRSVTFVNYAAMMGWSYWKDTCNF